MSTHSKSSLGVATGSGGSGGSGSVGPSNAVASGKMSATTTTITTTAAAIPPVAPSSSPSAAVVVVAALAKRSPHPFLALAVHPARTHAVLAGKDFLQVVAIQPHQGLTLLKTVPVAPHWQQQQPVGVAATDGNQTPGVAGGAAGGSSSKQQMSRIYEDGKDNFIHDTFGFGLAGGGGTPRMRGRGGAAATPPPGGGGGANNFTNVNITDVAWSCCAQHMAASSSTPSTMDDAASVTTVATDATSLDDDTSLIAVAGSNGVIVIWSAAALLARVIGANPAPVATVGGGALTAAVAPEAVLAQHSKTVHRLAWHGKRHGVLLSTSGDGTVILWERTKVSKPQPPPAAPGREGGNRRSQSRFSLFSKLNPGNSSSTASSSEARSSFTWQHRVVFESKSENGRDVAWSPYYDDVFALVTTGESLVCYHRQIKSQPMVKITAHAGDSVTLDWHPLLPDVIATGGEFDRCVKIWDLKEYLDLRAPAGNAAKDESINHAAVNKLSWNSRGESVNTDSSDTDRSSAHSLNFASRTMNSTVTFNSFSYKQHHSKGTPKAMIHVLTTSAAVTRVKWRPPAHENGRSGHDRHTPMLAVATAPIKGAHAGGGGLLALWSYHRPFMPLSVVEGHKEGAVTDFEWLDTPQAGHTPLMHAVSSPPKVGSFKHTASAYPSKWKHRNDSELAFSKNDRLRHSHHGVSADVVSYPGDAGKEHENAAQAEEVVGIWQHVISVGRDGRCLVQSFARGDRPIVRVPPSCFAMANLSPFQHGYGSLQIFSVSQNVPSTPRSEFLLTGLRRDHMTDQAPGFFREPKVDVNGSAEALPDGGQKSKRLEIAAEARLPATEPQIVFNVVDQGDLDDSSARPVADHAPRALVVAPEVVHLSRFADQYLLYPDEFCPTLVQLCYYNGGVAANLHCRDLVHMWRMLASILQSAGMASLPDDDEQQPRNALEFVVLPTIKALLEERANAGDVQSCVALCEVLQVVKPNQSTTRVPGLEIELVREWYLSYIDLLRDMCLFSHAAFLIRSCNDPYIAALSQKATTIHESCPHCGKPLLHDGSSSHNAGGARVCKSCSQKIARCFLCNETVHGMYVWCQGCGHGGHLEHALQWFGNGSTGSGKPVREVCPTGCGHRCNMMQQLSAFPRTEILRDLSAAPGAAFHETDVIVGSHVL